MPRVRRGLLVRQLESGIPLYKKRKGKEEGREIEGERANLCFHILLLVGKGFNGGKAKECIKVTAS